MSQCCRNAEVSGVEGHPISSRIQEGCVNVCRQHHHRSHVGQHYTEGIGRSHRRKY
uniref:Uncharacterized protein n=1 Tax=Octopus bimaculoides TaxID=37653 RepID=A0A0L8FUK0_OCTBM